MVRSRKQLDRAIADIESSPGIVLYTLVNPEISDHLEDKCRELGLPCVSVLGPVLDVYRATIPFFAILLLTVLVITYWPALSLYLISD